jgi:hypothetical protein
MSRHRPDEALRPREGARLLLELDEAAADGATARYHAVVYTPDSQFEYQADLGLDGASALTPLGPRPDPDLEAKLEMLARLTARGAAKKLEDGLPPWPHRVLRWKGPGRG